MHTVPFQPAPVQIGAVVVPERRSPGRQEVFSTISHLKTLCVLPSTTYRTKLCITTRRDDPDPSYEGPKATFDAHDLAQKVSGSLSIPRCHLPLVLLNHPYPYLLPNF